MWYQRGFLEPGSHKLHVMNLKRETASLPGGGIITNPEFEELGPKSCFVRSDLYSIEARNLPPDLIEKTLFGEIDRIGANAVRAWTSGDFKKEHDFHQAFYEYLDAQKIRTLKGLGWLKRKYPKLNQNQLMDELLKLRTAHCVMWTESVREIVNAKSSFVKFISSDHPVTVFNSGSPPTVPIYSFPYEPAIGLNGSQTVFPMDRDHCLILTNLEYAKIRRGENPLKERINARYGGETIVRTDITIRKRSLSSENVMAINYLIKTQADRQIVAGKREWLPPEAFSWKEIGKVLMPNQDDLWEYGGESYFGMKDGTVIYQDQFGSRVRYPNRGAVPDSMKKEFESIKKHIKKTNGGKEPDF